MRAAHFAGTEFRLAGLRRSRGWCRCRRKGATTCSRPHTDGLLDATDGWCTSSPRNHQSWSQHPDPALHSESLASDHGNGSQRWFAWSHVKVGNQQVALCDQGTSAWGVFFLCELGHPYGRNTNSPKNWSLRNSLGTETWTTRKWIRSRNGRW